MTGTMPFILMVVQTHMAQTLTRQYDDAVRNVAREARTRIPSYPLTPDWPTGSCSTNSTDSAWRPNGGDLFHIDSTGRTLTYKVVSINVVTPDNFTRLKIEPGCDLVTLLTCTPYGITTTVSSSQANVPPYRKQWKNNVRSTYVRPSYALCHRLLGHRFRCRVGHTRP